MKEAIIGFLVANGIQLLVGIVGSVVLYFTLKSKSEKVKTIREIAYKVFTLVEQAIPDNTPNKTALKIDKALKLFNEMYKEIFDETPPSGIVEFAKEIWTILSKQVKVLKLDK
jgi:hypothetical protein